MPAQVSDSVFFPRRSPCIGSDRNRSLSRNLATDVHRFCNTVKSSRGRKSKSRERHGKCWKSDESRDPKRMESAFRSPTPKSKRAESVPSGSSKWGRARGSRWETICGWRGTCSSGWVRTSGSSPPSTPSRCRETGTGPALTATSPPRTCAPRTASRELKLRSPVPPFPHYPVPSSPRSLGDESILERKYFKTRAIKMRSPR